MIQYYEVEFLLGGENVPFCDYHIHTCYSFDADKSATPRAICQAAIERRLTDIAFTDHFDVNAQAEGLYTPYDADAAYSDIMQAKEEFKNKINITYGIELGQANQYTDLARKMLNAHPYEFVLASLHNLRSMPDFYFLDFKSMESGEIFTLMSDYFDEMTEMIKSIDKIDSLSHITYPCRYIALAEKSIDLSTLYGKIESIFKQIISRDIALEINSSTHIKGLGFCMPDRELLSLYRECGGRLITLGSDAHSPSAVGSSIPYAAELAKSCGFDSALVVRGGNKELMKL